MSAESDERLKKREMKRFSNGRRSKVRSRQESAFRRRTTARGDASAEYRRARIVDSRLEKVRKGRGSASLVRWGGERRQADETSGKGKGKRERR